MEKHKELQEAFGALIKEYKISKGYMGEDAKASPDQEQKFKNDHMAYMINNVSDRLKNLENGHYDHISPSSHIPPIKGAAQMKKVLGCIGLGEDYDVVKPKIFASKSSSNGVTVEAEYKKS